jgi:hypothetical protein
MPIVMVSHAPSRDLSEQVAAEAHTDAERPDGLIIHTASETADATVRIVDVWESQQHVDEFERTRLVPAFEAIGAPGVHRNARSPSRSTSSANALANQPQEVRHSPRILDLAASAERGHHSPAGLERVSIRRSPSHSSQTIATLAIIARSV